MTKLTPATWLASFDDALQVSVVEVPDGFDIVLKLDHADDEETAQSLARGIRRQLNEVKKQLSKEGL